MWLAACGAGNPADSAVCADEPAADLAQYFGFKSLELFKLQERSGNLVAGDMNHDGLTDLALVDNSNSRIDLLLQRKLPVRGAVVAVAARINSIEHDWRFEHRKISVDKAISALTLGDFNADGRTDLAYFGLPDRLILRFQPEHGEWTQLQSLRLPDVQLATSILAAGDLNHDGKQDLAVLGKHETYLVHQGKPGELAAPERLMNTSDKLSLVKSADLDGDGRLDLCYLADDQGERALCARLQSTQGRLGPELRFELDRPRAIAIREIDGRPGMEVVTIQAKTGRVKLYQWERPKSQPGELAGQLIQYGFGQQGVGRDRDLATGDLDGDGLIDVVVTDPDSAQMMVFQQRPEAGLDQGTTFPGLVGATQVRVGELDSEKGAEVAILSPSEKTIGISRFKDGRLTFPQPLPLEKEPAALDLTDLNADGVLEIVYVGKERNNAKTTYTLRALQRSAQAAGTAEWKPYQFAPQTEVGLSLKGDPERLVTFDANGDRKPDYLIFQGGSDRPPAFLRTSDSGLPTEVAAEGGFGLGNVAAGALFIGRLETPAVLVTQANFARNLRFMSNNQWQVVDQYNATELSAKIAGAATINLDGQPGEEVVLVDLGVKKLRVLHREGSLYRPWREVEIGAFPYKSTHVADLNGDGQSDLLLFGGGKFGVLYAGQADPRLKELASYETKLEKVHFSDVVAGDLNGDGRVDLALIDTQSQCIEILDYTSQFGLRHALYFKIFEAKSLAESEDAGSEPRESLIVDVTGDGRADLVLLSQDRVLLYPQDDGQD
jgi:hypothetical protein